MKSGKTKILNVLDTPHPQTVDISFIKEIEYIPSLSTIEDDDVISTSYLPVYKKNNKNLQMFGENS